MSSKYAWKGLLLCCVNGVKAFSHGSDGISHLMHSVIHEQLADHNAVIEGFILAGILD